MKIYKIILKILMVTFSSSFASFGLWAECATCKCACLQNRPWRRAIKSNNYIKQH